MGGCLVALLVSAPAALADPTPTPNPPPSHSKTSPSPTAGTPQSAAPTPSIPPASNGGNPITGICNKVGGIIPGVGDAVCGGAGDVGDCKNAPPVTGPLSAPFADWPGVMPEKLPPPGDPFASPPTATVYDQYGLGGLQWSIYDPGCGGAIRQPVNSAWTEVANFLFMGAQSVVAGTGTVMYTALKPSIWTNRLDLILGQATHWTYSSLFIPLVGPVMILLSVLVAWRHHDNLTESVAVFRWGLMMLVLGMFISLYPLRVSHFADSVVNEAATLTSAPIDGSNHNQPGWTSALGALHGSVLYTTWQRGEVGNTNDPTRRVLSDRLFKDQVLSWRERQLLSGDQIDDLTKKKQGDYKAVAAYLQKKDPDAYDTLTGRHGATRAFWAFVSLLMSIVTCGFLFIAALIIILSLLSIRLALMIGPLLILIGMHPNYSHHVRGIASYLAVQVVNALKFFAMGMVFLLVVGFLMAPDSGVSPLISTILLGVLSFIGFHYLKPFSALMSVIPGTKANIAAFATMSARINKAAAAGGADRPPLVGESSLLNFRRVHQYPREQWANTKDHYNNVKSNYSDGKAKVTNAAGKVKSGGAKVAGFFGGPTRPAESAPNTSPPTFDFTPTGGDPARTLPAAPDRERGGRASGAGSGGGGPKGGWQKFPGGGDGAPEIYRPDADGNYVRWSGRERDAE
jgi:hypothetical protein